MLRLAVAALLAVLLHSGAAAAVGRPFAVVDKTAATMAVYHADGTLAGTTPVLVGRTPGDSVLPGTGERAQSGTLRPEDQTTPAGTYDSEPGRNLDGEAVVWVDHANALAIHRLRPGRAQADRLRRLASPVAAERRASAGCVVVPVAFWHAVVAPLLGSGPGVVYVLPEDAAGSRLARVSMKTSVRPATASGSR